MLKVTSARCCRYFRPCPARVWVGGEDDGVQGWWEDVMAYANGTVVLEEDPEDGDTQDSVHERASSSRGSAAAPRGARKHPRHDDCMMTSEHMLLRDSLVERKCAELREKARGTGDTAVKELCVKVWPQLPAVAAIANPQHCMIPICMGHAGQTSKVSAR
jgi:hypothetical protein